MAKNRRHQPPDEDFIEIVLWFKAGTKRPDRAQSKVLIAEPTAIITELNAALFATDEQKRQTSIRKETADELETALSSTLERGSEARRKIAVTAKKLQAAKIKPNMFKED